MIHNLKIPKKINYEKFFLKEDLKWIVNLSKKKVFLKDHRVNKKPHLPDLKDLYFLYQLIILNNRTTVLEYGCGWSTLIMHLALLKNDMFFFNSVGLCENADFIESLGSVPPLASWVLSHSLIRRMLSGAASSMALAGMASD